MPKPQLQQPLYLLPQEKKRLLLPKLLTFIFLGLILYLGVLLNLYLLKLSSSVESITKLTSLILIIIIIIAGTCFNFRKAKQKYFFYPDKIVFGKKEILLSEITALNPKRNFLDKLFKTYSLALNQKFKIKNISQKIQLQDYIQKLINYARTAY